MKYKLTYKNIFTLFYAERNRSERENACLNKSYVLIDGNQ